MRRILARLDDDVAYANVEHGAGGRVDLHGDARQHVAAHFGLGHGAPVDFALEPFVGVARHNQPNRRVEAFDNAHDRSLQFGAVGLVERLAGVAAFMDQHHEHACALGAHFRDHGIDGVGFVNEGQSHDARSEHH